MCASARTRGTFKGEWSSLGIDTGGEDPDVSFTKVRLRRELRGKMTGTSSQIEWAEQIKRQVNDEFDRVAAAFADVAVRQSEPDRADTRAIIAILQEKRREVMQNDAAGYFIHDWQELAGRVRQIISRDPAYLKIHERREGFRKRGGQADGVA